MSILNEPSDGTLSVLLALRGALRVYGAMSKDRLLSLCAPEAVTDGDRARKTLQRWLQLGAFIAGDGRVQLAEGLMTDATDNLDVLRAALLEIVLRSDNNPAMSEDGGDGSETESRARDFVRAVSWYLLQDPYSFKGGFDDYVDPLQKTQRIAAVQNDVRWNGFVRWSTFLGTTVKFRNGILPNPAFALRHALRQILPGGKRQELGPVLDRLKATLPILPGGTASVHIAAEGQTWRAFAPHEVAPTTTLALLQLRESGFLNLTRLADATIHLFLGRAARVVEEFTHVEVVS